MVCLKEENNINLYRCKNSEVHWIKKFYYDQSISNTFAGERIDRLITSVATFIIKKDNEDIGFILIVPEKDFYNVDMGIITKYQNKGYGSKALGQLKEIIKRWKINNVILEVKVDNISANKSIISNKLKLYKTFNNKNYYVLNNPELERAY